MSAGHTPGPWAVRGADTYRWQIETAEAAKKATVIARVCTPPKGGAAASDANAKLLAAAPDMLAALKLAEAEEVGNPSAPWPQVRAAIAKAEGRS